MKTKIKESDIQRAILKYLNYLPGGAFFFRTNNIGVPLKNGGFRPSPVKGLSDIIGIRNGQFIAIEVKKPGKKPTSAQKEFLDSIRKAGGTAIVATCVDDIEELI